MADPPPDTLEAHGRPDLHTSLGTSRTLGLLNLWTDYFAQTRMVRGGVTHAVAEQQGRGLLSLMVHNEAREMAYLDPFWVFSIMALAALPLILLMKKAVSKGEAAMH